MELAVALLLACGLALDSCLVALARGLATREPDWGRALLVGVVFGLFQGGMAVAGSFAGEPVARAIGDFDHWIAFAVLGWLGIATIRGGSRGEASPTRVESLGVGWLIAAAIATSLDALAAGFSMSLAQHPVWTLAITTAVITAVGSCASFRAGRMLDARWQRIGRWVAGSVLIAVGAQILWTHLQQR
jgi:putative Mn2+ efflux pump MntP